MQSLRFFANYECGMLGKSMLAMCDNSDPLKDFEKFLIIKIYNQSFQEKYILHLTIIIVLELFVKIVANVAWRSLLHTNYLSLITVQ